MRHAITPKLGTVTRERDGEPGNLEDQRDYPALATCVVCGKPVRCERWYHKDWEHVGGEPRVGA